MTKAENGPTLTYAYDDAAHKHAVTHLNGVQNYWYDANGNMTKRIEGGTTYTQTFDAENRLETVTVNGQTSTYTYDGDGNRVKKIENGVTTIYVGALFEKNLTTNVATSYYLANGQPVALRQNTTVSYLHGDHLGSTSLTTDSAGNVVARQMYLPYGQVRSTTGTLPTDKGFTGQRLDATGLMFYNARYYSTVLGRFISADTIVPEHENPQTLNRFSYTNNNPLNYIDPSGHCGVVAGTVGNLDCTYQNFENMSLQDRVAWIQALMKEPGLAGWFNNIYGVMQSYVHLGMASQTNWNTSWLSQMNAGILLSIHDGYAMFNTQQAGNTSSQGQSGNAGNLWKDFFMARNANPVDPNLSRMWGKAEAGGTAYGRGQAAARGTTPGPAEQAFLAVGDAYRDGSLPTKGVAVGAGLGMATGGMLGYRVCGPKCALTGALVGGSVGGGLGYGIPKYAEDPRNTIGPYHPTAYVAYGFLLFR